MILKSFLLAVKVPGSNDNSSWRIISVAFELLYSVLQILEGITLNYGYEVVTLSTV